MPNHLNVKAPALILGAGRTASTYVISHLRYSVRAFQEIIENDVYRTLYESCTSNWWCKDWPWMTNEPSQVTERIHNAIRAVLVELFPSDMPRWAMKMLWAGHDPDLVDGIFPQARFLHLVRDPRANIPSIVERIGWSRELAEARYVESNTTALAFERFGPRYLRVRQEDFDADRLGTWRTVCAFLDAPFVEDAKWTTEVNVSKSQVGKTDHTRPDSRVSWQSLTPDVRRVAERLGYGDD